jgi:iron-sulfur cluster assembly protein
MMTKNRKNKEIFYVTKRALNKIEQIRNESDIPIAYGVRIKVTGNKDTGLKFDIKFEQKPGIADVIIKKEGVKFFIDGKSLFYLRELKIDYKKTENGEGFLFEKF